MTTSNHSGEPGRTRTKSFLCSYCAKGNFSKTSRISPIMRAPVLLLAEFPQFERVTAGEVLGFLEEEIQPESMRSKGSPRAARLPLIIPHDTLPWPGQGFRNSQK